MATWVQKSTGLSGTTYQIVVDGSRLFAATSEGVFYSDDNGDSWTASTGISFAYALTHVGSNVLYAVTRTGGLAGGAAQKIYKSTNNGTSFSDSSTGIPTPSTNGVGHITSVGTNVYTYVFDEGVYYSTDAGANWSQVNTGIDETFPTSTSANQLFSDSANIYLYLSAVNYDRLYKLVDGETTWTAVQTVAGTVTSQGNEAAIINSIVYTNVDDGIKSSDGTTWSDFTTQIAGAQSIATYGAVLYINTLAAVSSSSNLGSTWTDITGDLPISNNGYSLFASGGYLFASLNSDAALYRTAVTAITPSDPTNLTITRTSATAATLSWTASDYDTKYNIYSSTKCFSTWTDIADSATTTYNITDLTATSTVSYAVTAVNETVESDYSNVVYTDANDILPALSSTLYQTAVNLVRILAHESGNTTVITDAEVLAIIVEVVKSLAKENWKSLQPYYLRTKRFNITGSANPYTSSYQTITPYMDKLIGAVFLLNCTRHPIQFVTPDVLERASKMTSTYANSVLATQYDGSLSLFVGTGITATPTSYLTEIYYYRQAISSGITTSNYDSTYIDLPDSLIPDVVDRAVMQLEKYKD